MTAATIDPIFVADAPTAIATLTGGPPVGEEWSVDVRAANKTGAEILYRLYITTSADNVQAAGAYRAYDFAVPAADARDIEVKLTIPSGYKLQHRASAAGLDVTVTGRKRSAA